MYENLLQVYFVGLILWVVINKAIGVNCQIDAAVCDLNPLHGFLQVLPQFEFGGYFV